MDAKAEIPNFKLAKVGKDREKKRPGIPVWLGGPRPGAPGFLAAGGTSMASKVVILFILSTLASAGFNIYRTSAAAAARRAAQAKAGKGDASGKPKLFSTPEYDAKALASLQRTQSRPSDSLGMVQGGLGGKTPEQLAAEAEAEAKAKAEAEAQASAEVEPPNPGAVPAGVDPAALAAAAAGAADSGAAGKSGKAGPFKSAFGALSTKLGGGAGLSGGVGQTFSSPKLGGGLGSLSPMAQARAPARTSARRANLGPRGRGRGLAARQLNAAKRLSGQAAGAGGEQSTAYAGAAFDNNPGQAQAITGAGAGETGDPEGEGGGGGSPGSTGGGGGGDSGPLESTGWGGDGYGMDDCVGELGEGYMNSPAGGCYKPVDPTNVTPWQSEFETASYMLLIAVGCLFIAGLLGRIKNPYALGFACFFASAAAIFAGIALGYAISIMTQEGGLMQGGLLALISGVVCGVAIYTAYGAADGASEASNSASSETTSLQNQIQPTPEPPAAPSSSGGELYAGPTPGVDAPAVGGGPMIA